MGFPDGSVVKKIHLPMQEITSQCQPRVQSLGQEDPLEKEMATHSSILAWEIPWTEEPGGLQSIGWQKSQTQFSNKTTTTEVYLCQSQSPNSSPPHQVGLSSWELDIWV